VVACRSKVDKTKLVANTRVALDMTTLTIMRALPREVRHACLRGASTHNQIMCLHV
jgi:ATP-dependent 26S proteasome regulatory subunit